MLTVLFVFILQLVDYPYVPPPSNNFHPLPTAPLANQGSVDTADGWDDDWDDDETVSSYSGDQETGTVASLPRRDTNSSGITRTGTVRKSMNRYWNEWMGAGEEGWEGT